MLYTNLGISHTIENTDNKKKSMSNKQLKLCILLLYITNSLNYQVAKKSENTAYAIVLFT